MMPAEPVAGVVHLPAAAVAAAAVAGLVQLALQQMPLAGGWNSLLSAQANDFVAG